MPLCLLRGSCGSCPLYDYIWSRLCWVVFSWILRRTKREGRTESVFAARRTGIHTWGHTLRLEGCFRLGQRHNVIV